MAQNDFRIVGAGTTFLSPTDFFIQVDTSAGAVTLVLPKISTILDSYTSIFQYIGIRVVDISNNASVNNITIQGFEDNIVNASSSIVLNTNGVGGIITLIGDNQWSFQKNSTSSGGGGGGANTPIDITYIELYNNIQNSQLIAGQNYRLTDYQSTNILNGSRQASAYLNNNINPTDPNFNPVELYTSPTIEHFVFQAISSSEINPQVVSEEFPLDIICYEPSINKIVIQINIFNGAVLNLSSGTLNVSGFDLQFNGTNCFITLPTETPVLFNYFVGIQMDFTGKDSSLQEVFLNPIPNVTLEPSVIDGNVLSNIEISSDGLTITFLDLDATDYSKYEADTLGVLIGYSLGSQKGLITSRKNYFPSVEFIDLNFNVDCTFDWRSQKYRRFEIDISSINPNLGTGYYGVGDNPEILGVNYPTTGNYVDVYTINNFEGDYLKSNITITGNYLFFSDNNVFRGGGENIIVNGCADNSFGILQNVSIVNSSNNIIDNMQDTNQLYSFDSNVIWYLSRCQIDSYFAGNNILNGFVLSKVQSDSYSNIFDNISNCSFPFSTTNNIFLGDYFNNDIVRNCSGNQFISGSSFTNCQFLDLIDVVPLNPVAWTNNKGYGILDGIKIDNLNNNNITGQLIDIIGIVFNNNIVNSQISGFSFGNISSNQFNTNYTNNTMINMYYNIINSTIDNCTFNNDLINNIFQTQQVGVSFVTATHIYGNYLCTIFLGSDGNTYLQYFDATIFGSAMLYVASNS